MEPTIETLEATPTVSVRATVRMQEIGDHIGEMLPAVMGAAGGAIRGPVYARWHDWDVENGTGDMELGVPVAQPIEADGVTAETLPAGRAAVLWHIGPYDQLVTSWGAMRAWVEAQGLASRGAPWEEYHDEDCSAVPPEELRTRIVWPVA